MPTTSVGKLLLGSGAIMLIVAAVVIIGIRVLVPERMHIPVAIVVCGYEVPLNTLNPDQLPPGCERVASGLDFTMSNPDSIALLYESGFYGFRKLKAETSNATLTVRNVISEYPISVLVETDDGVNIVVLLSEDGASWTGTFRLTPDANRMVVVIITSPALPPTLA